VPAAVAGLRPARFYFAPVRRRALTS